MAKAITARQKGDRWQGLFFWQKAAPLLRAKPIIASAKFESGPKGFDDVVITYPSDAHWLDPYGQSITADHYQCKWHVGAGSFGWEELIDPTYINATSMSLLERLRDAVREDTGLGRFILATTDQIKSGDQLESIIGRDGGEILIHRLFDGTGDRSKKGRIRKAWRERLGVSDDELRVILRRLSIQAGAPDLKRLSEQLDATLTSVGLAPIDHSKSVTLYDDAIWRWHSEGTCYFKPDTLRSLCEREGFLLASCEQSALVLGVRTFTHPIDDLVLRANELCDLRTLFDGRSIKNSDDWKFSIAPRLSSFLIENTRRSDFIRLILDTHYSVAIAAGYVLNIKSGKKIEIEQRTGGRHIWTTDWSSDALRDHDCVIQQIEGKGERDIVVELSLTRDVSSEVLRDIDQRNLDVFSHIKMRPVDGISSKFVRDGNHAYAIAESLIDACRKALDSARASTRVHFYFSGPNAIAFYIGQHAVPIGEMIVYEWDFENLSGGGYQPGLSLPF